MKHKTNSASQTQKIAHTLALKFKDKGGIITLSGDLGAGKTTFTQGFAQGLGIKDKIISPTFIIMRNYENLYHVDLYRLDSANPNQLGLPEIFQDPKNIVLIEWPERLNYSLPDNTTKVSIKIIGKNSREIEIV